MAVVKEYISPEGTRIIIHDDYCRGQTKEEAQEIINDISKLVYAELAKQNGTA